MYRTSLARTFSFVALGSLLLACGEGTNPPVSSGGTTGSGGASGGNATSGGAAATGGDGGTGGTDGSGASSGTGGLEGTMVWGEPYQLPPAGTPGQVAPTGEPGGLQVLDWAGFQAALSYTFDDTNSSQISHFGELMALNVPMTFYLQTNKSEISDNAWGQAYTAGHELGNHSHSHPQEGTAMELEQANTIIEENFGVRPLTMAAPYGDGSYATLSVDYFLMNRGVSGGTISPGGGNQYKLPTYIPAEGALADAFNQLVDGAYDKGVWQTVLVHGFTGGSDGAYLPVDFAEFESSVEYAKSKGDLWIDTVLNVGAYWLGQQLLEAAEPTMTDGSMTWTWTLPRFFPQGRSLRVTTTGGNLSQAGTPVEWNDNGYYEVALDAGTLTLGP